MSENISDPRPDPVQTADDEARALAVSLLRAASHAALAWISHEDGLPGISRIALGLDHGGLPLTLISALAPHRAALAAHPAAALMVGEAGDKGDPLTHARLMVRVEAETITRTSAEHAQIRAHWLSTHPKSKLYIDFPDFTFVRLHPVSALLNGGFARAWRLSPADLRV